MKAGCDFHRAQPAKGRVTDTEGPLDSHMELCRHMGYAKGRVTDTEGPLDSHMELCSTLL